MQRTERADESSFHIFINEVMKGTEFCLRERIDQSPWGSRSFIQVYFEVIQTIWGKDIGLRFTKNISEIMILRRNCGKVQDSLVQCSLAGRYGCGRVR